MRSSHIFLPQKKGSDVLIEPLSFQSSCRQPKSKKKAGFFRLTRDLMKDTHQTGIVSIECCFSLVNRELVYLRCYLLICYVISGLQVLPYFYKFCCFMNSNFVYMSNRVYKIAIFGSLRCNPHHGEYVTELRYWPPPPWAWFHRPTINSNYIETQEKYNF
jgi:hypothetical protein